MIKPQAKHYSKVGQCQLCGCVIEMKTSTQKYCKKCAKRVQKERNTKKTTS